MCEVKPRLNIRGVKTIDTQNPIKELRELAGLSQAEMANRRGISRSAQKQGEDNGARVVLANLIDIAALLGFEVQIVVAKKK